MMSTTKTITPIVTMRKTGDGFASMTREVPKFAITLLCELDKLKFVVAASRYVCREDRPDPGPRAARIVLQNSYQSRKFTWKIFQDRGIPTLRHKQSSR